MARAGIFCLILGIGSFLLPMMGMQFRLLNMLGENTWMAGAGLSVLGVVLLVASGMSKQKPPPSKT